jgi:hypothetical protein
MLQLLQQQQQAAMQATNAPAGFEPCCDSCSLAHNSADNPTAVALSVADQLRIMAAAGTTAQRKLLLHCLLQFATTSTEASTAAALAAKAIHCLRPVDHQDAASLHVAIVQPKSQMLLLQALRSSNRIVSTAAADILAGLWQYIHADDSNLAAVPGYAATMQQAAAAVLSNSSLAAAAAELCWYASKKWSGSSDLLVVHATALLEAAADVPVDMEDVQAQQQQQQQQQQDVRCQIFSLAALCSLSDGEGLQNALAAHIAEEQLPPLLQVLLDRQMGDDEYSAAANAAVPQLVTLLQRLLHALRCSGEGSEHFEERLAVAAREVLSSIENDLLQYVLDRLARQLEQQQQQQQQPTFEASLQPGHQLLAELLLECGPGPNLCRLQHLDEASKPACLSDGFIGRPVTQGSYWVWLVEAAPEQTREAVVSALLLQATREAAAAAAAAAAGSNSSSAVARAAASSSRSSKSSSSSKPVQKAGTRAGMHSYLLDVQKPRWCWGCHVHAINQPHSSSQSPSTAAAAAAAGTAVQTTATERLQGLALQCDKSLQLPLHVLKKQSTQQQLLAAFKSADLSQGDCDRACNEQQQQQHDRIGVQDLVLLLYHHWPLLQQEQQQQEDDEQPAEHSIPEQQQQQQQQQQLTPEQQRVSAVLLQQLQAGLAGNAAAMHLINDLSQFSCVKDWLVQHADEVASILAAEPWMQQQQDEQPQIGHIQPQQQQQQQQQWQVEESVVLASQLLLQLLKHDKAAVVQRCSLLPAWLQRWLLGTKQARQQSVGSLAASSAAAEAEAEAATSTSPAAAATGAAEDTSTAAYLSLLMCNVNIWDTERKQDLLLHVAAAAPAEVLAAVMQPLRQQQEQQQWGWECSLLPAVLCQLSGWYLGTRLWTFWRQLAAAALPERMLRRVVVALLQCVGGTACTPDSSASSSSSSGGSVPVLARTGFAGSATATPQMLQRGALAALHAICSGRMREGQPGHAVLLSLLTDPQHLQQLLQALLHCCCSPRSSRDPFYVDQSGEVIRLPYYHQLYMQLWGVPQIAAQPHMVSLLQQLISAALRKGNDAAVLMLDSVAHVPAVAAVLVDHTADVLAAVRQQGQSQQQQKAARKLLDLLSYATKGIDAVMRHDWLFLVDIMCGQAIGTSCSTEDMSNTDEVAAPTAVGSCEAARSSDSNTAAVVAVEAAAGIVACIARTAQGQQLFATGRYMRLLLLSALHPSLRPAMHNSSSSSSNAAADSDSTTPAAAAAAAAVDAAVQQVDAGSAGAWSGHVAEAAMTAIKHIVTGHFRAAGIAAVLQHLDLLLAVLQQTEVEFDQLNPVLEAAGLLQIVTRSELGLQQLCSSMQYVHQLLDVFKHTDEQVALTAVSVVNRMLRNAEGAQLITQQCCFDRLVGVLGECVQHLEGDVIALLGTILEAVLPEGGLAAEVEHAAQRGARPAAGPAEAGAAAAGHAAASPAAAAAAAAAAGGHVSAGPAAAAAADVEAAAAGMPAAGTLVVQRWHVEQLVDAAQSAQLTMPAASFLNRICAASDECALLLGPFRGALRKAADLFGQLAGVEWAAAHPDGGHVFAGMQPLIDNRELVKTSVECICLRVHAAAVEMRITQVPKAKRELWEAIVCFAEAYARYNACRKAAQSAHVRQGVGRAQMVRELQQQQLDAALEALVASSAAHDAVWRPWSSVLDMLMLCLYH